MHRQISDQLGLLAEKTSMLARGLSVNLSNFLHSTMSQPTFYPVQAYPALALRATLLVEDAKEQCYNTPLDQFDTAPFHALLGTACNRELILSFSVFMPKVCIINLVACL